MNSFLDIINLKDYTLKEIIDLFLYVDDLIDDISYDTNDANIIKKETIIENMEYWKDDVKRKILNILNPMYTKLHNVEGSGLIFALEGIDGAGKSTLIEAMKKDERFNQAIFLRHPNPDNEEINEFKKNKPVKLSKMKQLDLVKYIVMMYMKDIISEWTTPIANDTTPMQYMHEGRLIITDRSILSTIAYQSAMYNCDLDVAEYICSQGINIEQSSYIYIKVKDTKTALQNILNRSISPVRWETEDFLKKVAHEYDEMEGLITIINDFDIDGMLDRIYVSMLSVALAKNKLIIE